MSWWRILIELFGEVVEKLLDKPIKEKKEFRDVGKGPKDPDRVFTDSDW